MAITFSFAPNSGKLPNKAAQDSRQKTTVEFTVESRRRIIIQLRKKGKQLKRCVGSVFVSIDEDEAQLNLRQVDGIPLVPGKDVFLEFETDFGDGGPLQWSVIADFADPTGQFAPQDIAVDIIVFGARPGPPAPPKRPPDTQPVGVPADGIYETGPSTDPDIPLGRSGLTNRNRHIDTDPNSSTYGQPVSN